MDFVVQKVGSYLRAEAEGGKRHLFVISTYTIGKEKILTAVRCTGCFLQ